MTVSIQPRFAQIRLHTGLFLLSLGYAVLRYAVFGTVAWAQLPVFLVNKAAALYAILALALLAWHHWRGQQQLRGQTLVAVLAATVIHVLLSLMLMQPGYFPKLYSGPRLHFWAELALLCGALALGFWQSPLPRSVVSRHRAQWLGAALSLAHVTCIGAPGWLKPETWPGNMPPITLICALLTVLALLGLRVRRP